MDQVRTASQNLCQTPNLGLAIDEMMIRFLGRSAETHRMKNKPIDQGYKIYALPTLELVMSGILHQMDEKLRKVELVELILMSTIWI